MIKEKGIMNFDSPHSVLSSLATVPASQTVHLVAPVALTLFILHRVQADILEFLYVPAIQLTEI